MRRLQPKQTDDAAYERHKAAVIERQRRISAAGQDIGELPLVVNAERKAKCKEDFHLFCTEYFPDTFYLKFSEDHLRVIAGIERAVRRGELQAIAMPRGNGKTALCIAGALWSVLYGWHQYIALIGSTLRHARKLLEAIRRELESNERLLADFPEASYPVRRLERSPQRALKQRYHGAFTQIALTTEELVLPTIPGSVSSGAIISVCGITGDIRGQFKKLPDGQILRPTLVFPDDPQTKESARSADQTDFRLEILQGDVLYMAGPDKRIAGLMPCTVIEPWDFADQILDSAKHPEWHGIRTKLVYKFSDNMKMWEEYGTILGDSQRAGGVGKEATAFYKEHRAEMDAGAVIAWPERKSGGDLSALQYAMDLMIRNPKSFWAEMQNEPQQIHDADNEVLAPAEICGRLNGIKIGTAPTSAQFITAYIDVQGPALYYVVTAWAPDFTGYVIDYGIWPDQKSLNYSLDSVKRTLARAYPGTGFEGALQAGLDGLVGHLCGREWHREDGVGLRIGLAMIDASWGRSTELVKNFCRRSLHAAVLLPSHGRYIGASSKPFGEYTRHPGEVLGDHWWIPAPKRGAVRHMMIDTNFWKSFVHARMHMAVGDKGGITLFGRSSDVHRRFAEQLVAEYAIRTQGQGRTVDEWKIKPGRPDNHFLDCLAWCCVAASRLGCRLGNTITGRPVVAKRRREKVSVLEI